jgi:hypothetical protein
MKPIALSVAIFAILISGVIVMTPRDIAADACCPGKRGNIDGTGIVDSGDLAALVSYLTGGG